MSTRQLKRTGGYLALAVVSVIFLTPFVWMLRSSVMELSQIFEMPPVWLPNPWRWDNFGRALTALPFATYTRNTVIIVVLGVFGTVQWLQYWDYARQ